MNQWSDQVKTCCLQSQGLDTVGLANHLPGERYGSHLDEYEKLK